MAKSQVHNLTLDEEMNALIYVHKLAMLKKGSVYHFKQPWLNGEKEDRKKIGQCKLILKEKADLT